MSASNLTAAAVLCSNLKECPAEMVFRQAHKKFAESTNTAPGVVETWSVSQIIQPPVVPTGQY